MSIISIEGNIGSGKSTFVGKLKEYYKDNRKVVFLDEPVDDWLKIRDENNDTILTNFYRDTDKYAFSFQMLAYITRLNILKKAQRDNPGCILISERSVYTDCNVFEKMLYDDKKLNMLEHKIYHEWFSSFLDGYKLGHIFYVRTEPDKCHERVLKRKREGEDIKLEYLENCHNYHEKWVNELENKTVLDGNMDREEGDEYEDWKSKIDEYILSLEEEIKYNVYVGC